jgi:hypothetical protein
VRGPTLAVAPGNLVAAVVGMAAAVTTTGVPWAITVWATGAPPGDAAGEHPARSAISAVVLHTMA